MRLALATLSLVLASIVHAQGVCGDCNGDGVVTILDALLASQHGVGVVVLTGDDFLHCDVDSSGGVDVLDALRLAQEAAGLSPALACAGLSCSPPTGWVQIPTPLPDPGLRDRHVMAFDSGRGVTVLFDGGTNPSSPTIADTWELSGAVWTQRFPASSPVARQDAAMAYDSARGVTVLFGGEPTAGGALFADTWEWNGSDWTQVASTGPSARAQHAMVYDSTRMVCVLFGGTNNAPGSPFNDTWEWDGVVWTQVVTPSAPSPRSRHAMAYDSSRGVTVLYGGYATPDPSSTETWEYNGVDWAVRSSPFFPGTTGPLYDHAMAFDSCRGVTVVFGGNIASGRTWEWDGIQWTRALIVDEPTDRLTHAMVFDSSRSVTLIWGGTQLGGGVLLGDLWEY